MEKIKLGIYKHYKGKLYRVYWVAKHSETLEDYVVYDCMYENDHGQAWVRPLSMFTEMVEVDGKKMPRFEFIKEI